MTKEIEKEKRKERDADKGHEEKEKIMLKGKREGWSVWHASIIATVLIHPS